MILDLHALLGDRYPHAGFHDGRIHSLRLDYETRRAEFSCCLWVGDTDAAEYEAREATANGTLIVTGLLYCFVEPPGNDVGFDDGGLPDIYSVDTIDARTLPPNLPVVDWEKSFVCRIWINNWNAPCWIAASGADFVWL